MFQTILSASQDPYPNHSDFEFSPDVIVEPLRIPKGQVFVVRDDHLDGGTKQRAAVPFLEELVTKGVHEIAYASPFCGFAQVALAVSARAVGLNFTLFAVRNPSTRNSHAFTDLAESFGARIRLVESLEEAELETSRYARVRPRCQIIPLGIADPIYTGYLQAELTRQWDQVMNYLPGIPRRLWVPFGSGTLLGVLRNVVPTPIEIAAVNVHVLSLNDSRLRSAHELPNVKIISAAVPFLEAAPLLPPIPSNTHYDAKLWAPISFNADDGDVWWNVAR
jgi:hypothetical protein